ncbi:MAG: putative Inositol polyphosphate 5-phosphatase OCRL-1, partial [Streblomastix strix]
FRLFCGTFNVGASSPPLELLRRWLLLDHGLCHIYVITLQEIIEMTAKSVGRDLIINNDILLKPWEDKIKDELGCDFDIIYQQGTVDISLFSTKNKGAIGLSILLKGRPICFIASHLNSGRDKNDRREEDYQNILNNIFREYQKEKKHYKHPASHDFCFWMGDLNFRLDSRIQRIQIEEMLVKGEIDKLLGYDQLSRSRLHKKAFHDFEEMKISFGPTYRFDVQSHIFDTSSPHAQSMFQLQPLQNNSQRKQSPPNQRGSPFQFSSQSPPAQTLSPSPNASFNQLPEPSSYAPMPEDDTAQFLRRQFNFLTLVPLLYEKHQDYTISDHRPVSALFSLQPSDEKNNILGYKNTLGYDEHQKQINDKTLNESNLNNVGVKKDDGQDDTKIIEEALRTSEFLVQTSISPKLGYFRGTEWDKSIHVNEGIKQRQVIIKEKEKKLKENI